ncbi:MAG TPA: DUF1330 domain-containing protein [Candidatus Binatia bacterium]|nr:DUF1330 domain-containing protein [Candidatus Binatia bacterium]
MSAYFVCHNRITDAQKMGEYLRSVMPSLNAHGAEVLVVDESCTVMEGDTPLPRTIVIRFASRADAERWYNSPEYSAIRPLRLEATEGFAVLVNGFGA